MDRLTSCGYETDGICLICGLDLETRDHLFFECSFSASVWRNLMTQLHIPNAHLNWDDLLNWIHITSLDECTRLALLQGWQGAIYELWKERNRRLHDGVTLSHGKVFRLILRSVMDKCRAMSLLGSSRGDLLLQRWSHSHGFG